MQDDRARLFRRFKEFIKIAIGPTRAKKVLKVRQVLRDAELCLNVYYDRFNARMPWALRLARTVPEAPRVGMAVLAHERPDYLEKCLDSLFATDVKGIDITFVIQDDGSTDPRVRRIIEQPRPPHYRIVRYFKTKGHNSWGAAANSAFVKLMETDSFDIIGVCDSDALFHPQWLKEMLKICTWAKQHHKNNVLGPFSAFNSSNYAFHRVLGVYESPCGRYVVKERMGALTYFFFLEDLLFLGFFPEHKDDETLKTEEFKRLRVRNFCTETSWVEHIGEQSVLNQWRPTAVIQPDYGLYLPRGDWPDSLAKTGTTGYYRFVKEDRSLNDKCESTVPLDVVIPVIDKDLPILPYAVEGVRRYLRHPLEGIYIVGPDRSSIRNACTALKCSFVNETSLLPIRKNDIHYIAAGLDRAGWMYQQLLKLSGAVGDSNKFLVIDSDTVLAMPQVFEVDGCDVLLIGDTPFHMPYFEALQRLLGFRPGRAHSFVAHMMLFDRERLADMRNEIEHYTGLGWIEAVLGTIDSREPSCFSEYESYGHWMLARHQNDVDLYHCRNTEFTWPHRVPQQVAACQGKWRSVSFHHWL